MPAKQKPNIDIESDAGPSVSNPKDLTRIIQLARQWFKLTQEIAQLETIIADKTKQASDIEFTTLPEALMQVGMTEFRLDNGFSIAVDDFVRASIPSVSAIEDEKDAVEKTALQNRKNKALGWLRANDAASLIKNKLTAEFGKGEDKQAKKFFAQITKAGYQARCEESVNHQTLNSFIREKLRDGVNVPSEPFALFVGKRAKLLKPKSK